MLLFNKVGFWLGLLPFVLALTRVSIHLLPGFSSCGFVERMLGQLAAECPSLAFTTVLLGIITNGVTRHKSKSHLQDSQKPHLLGRSKSPIDLLVPNQELLLDEVCQLTGQQIISESSSEPEPESGTTWGQSTIIPF